MSIAETTGSVAPTEAPLDVRLDVTPTAALPEIPAARWMARYVLVVLGLDLLAATVASLGALQVRFGDDAFMTQGRLGLLFAVAVPLGWTASVALCRGYEQRFLGSGSEEFKRLGNAAVRLTAAVAFVAYAAQLSLARGLVVLALPAATALSVAGRVGARAWLHARRRQGRCVHRAVLLGTAASVLELVDASRRRPALGLTVVGACLTEPGISPPLVHRDVPVLGDVHDLLDAVRRTGADTVAVAAGHGLAAEDLRKLAWQLEGSGVSLLVSPALTDVAGPRIHIRPVWGLPLLHVEQPRLTGTARAVKALLDRTAAAIALVVLAPLLGVLALAVRVTSPGPALFRQERVGRDGRTFTLLKLRSMCEQAEDFLIDLREENEHVEGLLFKIRRDPRVTPLGRVLRRLSLDELPQLVNVLRGDMSLVGPRPPLPREVEQYGPDVRRRLLVKPGLTGLWQVSGRSDLAWDESVRLDLHYVENWSLSLDLMIIARTAKAVLSSSGAY